ncbi:MAG: DUF3880 domain-containing protein [Bacteroidales bacterium]|nr:DUF3880 domain-containing protein [Lachnoclostridium sp.]MCM1383921.1 DUF3880 domain-containing protein [Lachnoclostridium sp.]MCM1464630.1 DUF3880 domain-containing protein [Bacteroidales bacterium]
MKLLIYEWASYLQHDIYEICREKSITYDVFEWKFRDKNLDEEFEKWFYHTVDNFQYDALFSINFWPMLSKVCQKKGMKYLAWCYDAPLNVEHLEESLGNSVNYVFFFDRMQFERYRKMGFDTVWHLPLGINCTRLKNLVVSAEVFKRYQAEISFVGNLYESKIQSILAPMEEYTQGYLTALMSAQSKVYGYYMLDELLTDKLLEDINQQYLLKQPDTKFRLSKEALNFAMASEITRRERLILLNLCGKRFDTKVYCYEKNDLLQGIQQCGSVDYVSQMPLVFACSKINLNPSLRIIQSGIPLRAFDIMGAGGFLLSNYQEELQELYENEREMVIYENMGDAIEKADFYLRHEDLRTDIAQRGREKTLKEHSIQDRLKEILTVAKI